MNRNIIIFSVVFLALMSFSFENRTQETVNVYGWYGIMNSEVLRDFEKETGIKVVYDVYDNNDTLEAKLLATNSGYDVIFPSFIPYGARQCAMGAYSKLDRNQLPNLKNIAGQITDKFEQVGGDISRLIPIFWGTTGIAYDADAIKKIFPRVENVSYDLILEPQNISKISRYGVSFPEEYIDIFPQTAVFLGLADGASIKKPDKVRAYAKHFKSLRPYIKKFSSNTMISDLISGEIVLAVGSSDNAWRAGKVAKNVGKNIKYIIPTGSGILWIDCVGIPEKAPHKKNAHKFLNYLLRPEVAAKITNYSGILVNIPEAFKLYNKNITSDTQICPLDDGVISSLIVGTPSKNSEDAKADKFATRVWSQVRMNEFECGSRGRYD